MKVIISHDVDHLYSTEHLLDGMLVKYGARAVTEALSGVLSIREFRLRLGDLFRKQWHHVDELMDFDESHGIPSTFFFAMSRGAGLNYQVSSSFPVIQRVLSRGFDCGVHGIEYEDSTLMQSEYERFATLFKQKGFGIRMHYLRMNPSTKEKLAQAGYLFDSSEFELKEPYRVGSFFEFPLHFMDSREFFGGRSRQVDKPELIIENTKRKIAELAAADFPYLTLLFHDRYFCASFESYKNWYQKIIEYLQQNGHSYTSYREAVKELS